MIRELTESLIYTLIILLLGSKKHIFIKKTTTLLSLNIALYLYIVPKLKYFCWKMYEDWERISFYCICDNHGRGVNIRNILVSISFVLNETLGMLLLYYYYYYVRSPPTRGLLSKAEGLILKSLKKHHHWDTRSDPIESWVPKTLFTANSF